jgi:large subunit ribosomal protein L21
MYAIVDIAGQQFRVENGQKIYVHRLENKEGENVDFDQVLLIDNDGKISIGEPLVEGAFVEGKVLEHQKGDKVIVFKKKRRKGYQKRNGHRQSFSHIEILAINEKGAVKKGAKATVKADKPEVKAETTKKVTEAKPAEPKAKSAAKKPAAKKPAAKKTEAAAKKPAAKKPAAKKPAAKKPVAKKPATAKKPTTKATPAKSGSKATTTKGKASDKAK